MTIRYANGSTYDAVLLLHDETTLRVAVHGSDDATQLKRIGDVWVTEDCEPVQVDFAWNRLRPAAEISEEDCVCPHDLAAHLIHLLYAGEEDATAKAAPPSGMESPVLYRGLVS
jgi:hypothetical protein